MTSVTKNKPNKKNESFRFVLDLRCAQVRRICKSVEQSSIA